MLNGNGCYVGWGEEISMNLISGSPLEMTAMRILGDDFYALADFFLSIYKACLAYEKEGKPVLAAFVTRRCHVLSLIFQKIFLEPVDGSDWLSVYTKKKITAKDYRRITDAYYTTDTNLICQGGMLASYYKKTGELPYVLLVDEMLLHGRTLNHILTNLEHSILTALRTNAEETVNTLALQNELTSKLEIRMFIQNDEPLLLLSRYQRRLWADSIRPVRETRERSKQFALLVSVANVNNNSYSWSVVRKERPPEPVGLWGDSVRKVVTTHSRIRQTTWFWAYPTPGNPKAVFTFRWKHSNLDPEEKNNFYLGVPFALMGNIPLENSLKLYKRIWTETPSELHQFLKRYVGSQVPLYKENGAYWRRVSEINELVLCSLFARKLYGSDLTVNDLDLDMLARNLTNFTALLGVRDTDLDVRKELGLLWKFASQQTEERLTSYLDTLLADTAPLWKIEQEWTDVSERTKRLLGDVVDDEISELGYKTEKNARDVYRIGLIPNEKRLSSWGVKCYLTEKLAELIDDYYLDEPAEIYALLAILLQQMDLGVVSIAPHISEEEETSRRQEMMELRAGEQSLFIKPIQFKRYLPVLKQIKDRWGKSWSDVNQEIDRFVERLSGTDHNVDGSLALDLKLFLYQMNSVGQDPGDWDFPLTDSSPKWEFDGSAPSPEKPGHELLKVINEQQRLVRIYNQI